MITTFVFSLQLIQLVTTVIGTMNTAGVTTRLCLRILIRAALRAFTHHTAKITLIEYQQFSVQGTVLHETLYQIHIILQMVVSETKIEKSFQTKETNKQTNKQAINFNQTKNCHVLY